ncbi:MAG: hypothetical protein E7564_05430 [Ruminococcaceae bacterium]|nr:hypothetical protein [Oscillospiraceae bacterium]
MKEKITRWCLRVIAGLVAFLLGVTAAKIFIKPEVAVNLVGKSEVITSVKTYQVSFEKGYGSVKINLPENWVYEIDESENEETTKIFSLGFKPSDEEGFVEVVHCKNYFDVGAKYEQYQYEGSMITLGDKNGWIHIYPGAESWAYMTLEGFMGCYLIYGENAAWLEKYNDTVLDIIADSVLGEGNMRAEDALNIGKSEVPENYDDSNGYYDAAEGCWFARYFYFKSNKTEMHIVKIDSEGAVLSVEVDEI